MEASSQGMKKEAQQNKWQGPLAGILLVAVIGIIAHHIGKIYPIVGGAVTGIIIGFLIRNFIGIPKFYETGLDYTIKKLLKVAIVLMGFSLSFRDVIDISGSSVIVVMVTVVLGLVLTYFIGRLFGLTGNLPMLIGIGTSICGATAIATTSPILKAKEDEFVYAVNTILLLILLQLFYIH